MPPGSDPIYGNSTLPPGIRSRVVDNINGLAMHVLEAGFEAKGRPCILLLHGFPELAYSWRKIMLPLAAAGYHVVAPDQRGYGRTTGWDDAYDGDLASFRLPNLVRDALGLVSALGYRSVAAVVGHDFGSPVAAYCALLRPDVFRSVALMSAPFGGPPSLPFDTADEAAPAAAAAPSLDKYLDDLAKLSRPRKHYQRYYGTREADDNMRRAPQGIHAFLRAYYHVKSADWKQNKPFKLASFTADELAKMPTYYIMDLEPGHGGNRRAGNAVGGRDRRLPVASRQRTRRVRGRIRAHRVSGRRCNGIAAQAASSPPSLKPFPAAPSTCPPVSSPARATGASTRPPARSRGCSGSACTEWRGRIWSTAPAIGCSRSSRRK